VNSLRRGESAVAFACGAHLNMRPNGFEALTMMNMISADGRRCVPILLIQYTH
jgi:acyl transferase domain-containing protein